MSIDTAVDQVEVESEIQPEGDQLQDQGEQEEVNEEVKEEVPPTDGDLDEDQEEMVISIGDEPEQKDEAPTWVKDLRKKHKQAQQRIRDLEQKLQANNPTPEQVKLGPKPKLDQFDYDEQKFESALSKWYETKSQVEEQQARVKQAEQQKAQAWQAELDSYEEKKAALKVKDFEEAESFVTDTLSQTQQAIVVKGAENAALVFYALGKNPKKAAELAEITDPVKFSFQVAKLEKDLKVSNKRRPPPPERKLTGNGGKPSGAIDSTLERLREEARKTGNYTKVAEYKRRKKG